MAIAVKFTIIKLCKCNHLYCTSAKTIWHRYMPIYIEWSGFDQLWCNRIALIRILWHIIYRPRQCQSRYGHVISHTEIFWIKRVPHLQQFEIWPMIIITMQPLIFWYLYGRWGTMPLHEHSWTNNFTKRYLCMHVRCGIDDRMIM